MTPSPTIPEPRDLRDPTTNLPMTLKQRLGWLIREVVNAGDAVEELRAAYQRCPCRIYELALMSARERLVALRAEKREAWLDYTGVDEVRNVKCFDLHSSERAA